MDGVAQKGRGHVDDDDGAVERVIPTEPQDDDDIIRLDVGGVRMATRRSTLIMSHSDSLLARAFARDSDARWRLPRLADGAYFLDLNPTYFQAVLDVLRHGTAALSTLELPAERGVALLADYLNMPALGAACVADVAQREIAAADRLHVRTVAVAVIGADCTLPTDGFDVCDWTACRRVTVLSLWSVSRVRDVVAADVGIDPHHMEVHPCHRMRTGSVRPCVHMAVDDCDTPFGHVEWPTCLQGSAVHACWVVRDVRHVPRDEATTPVPLTTTKVSFSPPAGRTTVVFKRYDRAAGTIDRCVVLGFDLGETVESLLLKAMARLDMTGGTQSVRVYHEDGHEIRHTDRSAVFHRAYFCLLWIAGGGDDDDADGDTLPPTTSVPMPAHLLP